MKYHHVILAAVALLIVCTPGSIQSQEPKPVPALHSEATLAAASARAKKESRLVFLEFMMHTCPHCQAFKKQVLDAPAFREFAAQHLAVMIYDVIDLKALPEEEQKVAQAMQKKFHVQSVPTILIFSAAGKQLLRSEGYGGSSAETVVAGLLPLLEKTTTESPIRQ